MLALYARGRLEFGKRGACAKARGSKPVARWGVFFSFHLQYRRHRILTAEDSLQCAKVPEKPSCTSSIDQQFNFGHSGKERYPTPFRKRATGIVLAYLRRPERRSRLGTSVCQY